VSTLVKDCCRGREQCGRKDAGIRDTFHSYRLGYIFDFNGAMGFVVDSLEFIFSIHLIKWIIPF